MLVEARACQSWGVFLRHSVDWRMVVVEGGDVLHHEKKDGKYIHLYSPERQQQQVKEAPNTQQQKTNKTEKTTLKSELSGEGISGKYIRVEMSGSHRHSATERSRICLGGETKTGRKYWQPCFPVRLLCRRGYEKLRFSATISFYLGNDTRYVPVTILIRTCPCGSALAVAKALR